jgi:ribosomal-protein-alanine N-acetyltransferase
MLEKTKFATNFSQLIPGGGKDYDLDHDIYFSPFSLSALKEMHRYSLDVRLYEFFEFESFKTINETEEYMKKLLKRMSGSCQDRTAMYWLVRRKSDDYLIGTAGLLNLNYSRQSVEWGYGVDPELWGLGYILQIQEILKKFTFEDLELNRLYGITMVKNKRTIQSILAAGMKHEGVLRHYYCKDRRFFYDGWKYGMISSDYFHENKIKSNKCSSHSSDDVIAAISSVLEDDTIDMDTSMENTYNWDSLNHMAIMVSLKNTLGVNLNPSDVSRSTSVKRILEVINK